MCTRLLSQSFLHQNEIIEIIKLHQNEIIEGDILHKKEIMKKAIRQNLP